MVLGGARGSIVLGNHGVVVVVGRVWCEVVVVLGLVVAGCVVVVVALEVVGVVLGMGVVVTEGRTNVVVMVGLTASVDVAAGVGLVFGE